MVHLIPLGLMSGILTEELIPSKHRGLDPASSVIQCHLFLQLSAPPSPFPMAFAHTDHQHGFFCVAKGDLPLLPFSSVDKLLRCNPWCLIGYQSKWAPAELGVQQTIQTCKLPQAIVVIVMKCICVSQLALPWKGIILIPLYQFLSEVQKSFPPD